MKFLLLCAALTVAPAITYASTTPTSLGAPVTAKIEADTEKLICKKQEVIGSLIAKRRVCATARNWERNEALAKEHLDILTAPGHSSGPR